MKNMMMNKLLKLFPLLQDSLASATQVAEERVANMRTVRSFSREDREVATYTSALTHVLSLAYQESRARAFFFGMVSGWCN